ncbi:MAG: UDP-glucose/GDP-mannose dehydrogenase family protein [Bosea sp.]|jgi:UDPglucose 6-dehydrogenase|nr:UDP-glucose/GDP-mannose dehydrogenase family protein [Bosea sp. (in: a-proteobacteria)]
MKIAVVGTGYVGLVTGVCLALDGHEVTCIDRDAAKVAMMARGACPIYEDQLEALMRQALAGGHLAFTADIAGPVAGADLVFICVGTPPRPSDGHADMAQVHAAAAEIGLALSADASRETIVALKSTVPVGTGDEVHAIMARANPPARFTVVSNPEFLREGSAVRDFQNPDRIVVGAESEAATARMKALYAAHLSRGVPLLATNRRTSELIKYASNSFLALKITFINELANLCEEIRADVQDVSHGMGLDTRIGAKFLQPGPGFGGSCFPKDMLALMKTAQDHGVPLRTIETAVAVNDSRKGEMVRKITSAAGGSVEGRTIAVLGLTFKPDTDDMRASVSLVVIPQLVKAGATIRAYDPVGMDNARPLLPDIAFAASAAEALRGADLAVILTEWAEFRTLDLTAVASLLNEPVMVDLRNIFSPEAAAAAGLAYHSIGRAPRRRGPRPADVRKAG